MSSIAITYDLFSNKAIEHDYPFLCLSLRHVRTLAHYYIHPLTLTHTSTHSHSNSDAPSVSLIHIHTPCVSHTDTHTHTLTHSYTLYIHIHIFAHTAVPSWERHVAAVSWNMLFPFQRLSRKLWWETQNLESQLLVHRMFDWSKDKLQLKMSPIKDLLESITIMARRFESPAFASLSVAFNCLCQNKLIFTSHRWKPF